MKGGDGMTPGIHIGVAKNCKNPDSYGEICVRCNKCGRFDKYAEQEPTTLQQIIKKHNMDKLAYDEMSDFERDVLKYAEQEPNVEEIKLIAQGMLKASGMMDEYCKDAWKGGE